MSEENRNEKVESEVGAQGESSAKKTSVSKIAFGVAAASGGAILAVAMIGVAPTLLAGAAGYIAYHGMTGEKKAA